MKRDVLEVATGGSHPPTAYWTRDPYLRPCLEVNVQLVPIQSHKMSRNAQFVQKFTLYSQGKGCQYWSLYPASRLPTWELQHSPRHQPPSPDPSSSCTLSPALTVVSAGAAWKSPQSQIGPHRAGKADRPEEKDKGHRGPSLVSPPTALPRALLAQRAPSHPRLRHLAWVDIFTFWASFSRAMSSP